MKLRNKDIKNWAGILFFSVVLLAVQSCKKAVEVPAPSTSLIGANVFTDNKTATAVLTGVYDNMHSNSSFSDGNSGISMYMGTAADEMKNYYIGTAARQFYTNNLSPNPGTYFWAQFFKYIYVVNTAMEGITASATLSPAVKQQLLGEARFMRAFMNFYAVNLYGDIPIVTSTDYKVNNVIKRSPQADVYKAIVADLLAAQTLLTDDYKDAFNQVTTEKIRPNRAAATALLARAYLYTGDWHNAEVQATSLIEDPVYELSTNLSEVFLKENNESIWQLASSNPSITNTLDGYFYILKSAPGTSYHVILNTYLLNSFEAGDNRKTVWVGSYTKSSTTYYYPYKYKNNVTGSAVTENLVVLRLAEQYLIRAEARAHQSDISGAVSDINALRTRARGASTIAVPNPLPALPANIAPVALLTAILHERQVELFSEWGHRWFDLKRTGNLDAVMGGPGGVTAAKGGTWTSDDALLPLPISEILINPNLKQNPGYN